MLSQPVLVIICTLASIVIIIICAIIIFCFVRHYKEKFEEDDEMKYFSNFEPFLLSDIPQKEEVHGPKSDVRQLRRHSWTERSRPPMLTRKTVRFERPGLTKSVETVQPDSQYSQSTLNKQLGLQSNNYGNDTANGRLQRQQSENDPGGANSVMEIDNETDLYKLGKIQFQLKYDFQEQSLTLRIMRAINLPAKDFSGTSDPYVKIMLLPDKKQKLQTNIKRKNLNPRWNELFAFEGFPFAKLQSRTLYMQVLDYDRFSRDDPIGEIAIPLSDVDLASGHMVWKALQPCKGGAGKLGELLVSLCYQPTVGRITVVVMKARQLKAKDITGTSDPYVKIWLCHDGKKVEKKKTRVIDRELNPVFNESFIFDMPYEKIRSTTLYISCMDYDRMGRNELIGSVILGTKSGPMEQKHWNEMFTKPRQPVAQWHILKDFG